MQGREFVHSSFTHAETRLFCLFHLGMWAWHFSVYRNAWFLYKSKWERVLPLLPTQKIFIIFSKIFSIFFSSKSTLQLLHLANCPFLKEKKKKQMLDEPHSDKTYINMEGKLPNSEMKDFDLTSKSASGNYYFVVLYGDGVYILFVSSVYKGRFIQTPKLLKNN